MLLRSSKQKQCPMGTEEGEMFTPHQGTMSHMLHFINMDLGAASLQLRAHESNMTKREPQRQRAQMDQIESLVEKRGRGRPPRKQRSSTSNRIETPEERYERLTDMRERRKLRMQTETEEQRLARLVDSRERTRQKLLAETHEEREKRLKYLRDHQRQRIKTETKEERERRLLYLRERQKERIRTETPEEREKRLSRSRRYRKRPDISETEANVAIQQHVRYMRESQCQVILTESQTQTDDRDPLDLHDYHGRQGSEGTRDNSAVTIGRVWSLKPNNGVDDKLWLHNER